ncbi:MAG: hypothetical protein ABI905_11830 [Betaproteobacteria bacterium]
MKRNHLPLLLLLAVLAACGPKAAPPAEVKAESAGDAMRNDNAAIAARLAEQKGATDAAFEKQQAQNEKTQLVDSLAAAGKRWMDVVNEAQKTGRGDVDAVIKKMEGVKAEVEAMPVNECTGKARAAMSTAMASTIDAYRQFRGETGAASDTSKDKIAQAGVQYGEFERMLPGCR